MSHPNIVFILADDLGFGDVRANNPESKIPTPNLDRIAAEGMRFTDAHTNSAMCSPTRYGLMTGRYAWRTWLKRTVLPHFSKPLIDEGRMTLASLLKSHGYATAAVGKWHLGLGWQAKDGETFDPEVWTPHQIDAIDFTKPLKGSPLDHGFDYFFGLNASNNMLPYCFIENDRAVLEPDERKWPVYDTESPVGLMSPDYTSEKIDQVLFSKAKAWLNTHFEERQDDPFFLYFPSSAIHRPCLPSHKWIGKSQAGLRGDKVAELDDIVGRLLGELEKHGVLDNTLVIFSSDNGGLAGDPEQALQELADNGYGQVWPSQQLLGRIDEGIHNVRDRKHLTYGHRCNGAFFGYKTDIYEGGHRVPFLVRWPGKVTAGTVCDETICMTDMLTTVAVLLGETLPEDAGEDSYNILPLILDEEIEKPIREATVHHSGQGMFAIRKGEWKLVLGQESGGTQTDRTVETEGQLYNMETDKEETTNVYEEHPEVIAELTALLEKYEREGRSAPMMA